MTSPPSRTTAGDLGRSDGSAVRADRSPTAFSRPITTISLLLLLSGIVSGAASFAQRSPIHESAIPGTWAWPTHLVLAVGGTVWLAAALIVRSRRSRTGPLFTAPLRRRAAGRVWRTCRTAPLRGLLTLPPLVVLLYTPWRTGYQVIGGLDHNAIVNAWGGPTYLGAMACHFLDGALLAAAAACLVHVLLVRARD